MSEAVMIALLSGGITAVASVVVSWMQNNKTMAVMEERLKTLADQLAEVKDRIGKHNNFEGRLIRLEEHAENAERRLVHLEK